MMQHKADTTMRCCSFKKKSLYYFTPALLLVNHTADLINSVLLHPLCVQACTHTCAICVHTGTGFCVSACVCVCETSTQIV